VVGRNDHRGRHQKLGDAGRSEESLGVGVQHRVGVLGRVQSRAQQARGQRAAVGGHAGRCRVPDQTSHDRPVGRTSPSDRQTDVVPVPTETRLADRLGHRIGHGEIGQTDGA